MLRPPKRVAVVTMMRLTSQRAPGKLLRTLGGVSLAERAMRLVQAAARECATTAIAGVGEPALVSMAERLGLEVLHRSPASLAGETCEVIYERVAERLRDRFDWTVIVNPCSPFLRLGTVLAFFDAACQATRPLCAAVVTGTEEWDEDGRPLHWARPGTIGGNTKLGAQRYLAVPVLDAYPVDRLGSQQGMFADLTPWPVRRSAELLDLDTEEDWELIRAYEAFRQREGTP